MRAFVHATMLTATTVQSSAIKLLFETLKDVLHETTLTFDDRGMSVTTMDIKREVLIHVLLEREKFETFQFTEPVSLGVNVLNVHKLVKSVSTHDSITIQVDEHHTETFSLIFTNTEKHTETVYKINTLDLQPETFNIPDADMQVALTVRAVDFQKIIREMSVLADHITIEARNAALKMSCVGDYAERTTEIKENEHGLVFHKAIEETVVGTFSLKYLSLFTKATNLSHTVDLYMKQEFPLILRYNVVDLGELRFILAPKSESNGEPPV